MHKNFITFFLLFLACAGMAGAQSSGLKLWYRNPALKWTEALPLGNGRIGAMVFGGVREDRIQFNEETLWTGYPREYARPGASDYLDKIRQLLFQGRQKEAEALAGEKFMGRLSAEGDREAWIQKMTKTGMAEGDPSGRDFDDSQWKSMKVPSYEGWEAVGFEGLDGAVWLRRDFELPANWSDSEMILDLNRIRDQDFTYVNGQLVGSMTGTDPRKYTIPKGLLTPGKNSIAVLVLNFYDKGGIAGYKDTTRAIGLYSKQQGESSKLRLGGNWKYFVVNDSPPPVPHYQADYQPFGDLRLDFKHDADQGTYRRELDLDRAIATTGYSVNGVSYQRQYFVSQPSQALIIKLSAGQPGKLDFGISLSSPHKMSVTKLLNNRTISLALQVKDGALKGEARLHLVLKGGVVQEKNGRLVVTGADQAELFLFAATNYKNYHDITADPVAICENQWKLIAGKTFADLQQDHFREYEPYFRTFSIRLGNARDLSREQLPTDQRLEEFATVPDPSFAALYLQYGRYLLISSSRPGTQPANLQGIWNDLLAPPWGSKYTTNINLEMNYWPAELLNLSPMHQPLFNMIGELAETGKKTAALHYKAPGWVLHHNTDLWRGTAPINASNHGIWISGGAWLCHHLWEHYLFTQDLSFLRDTAYPLMKQAASFFDSFLIKDPATGWLISTPSNSPEQGGLVAGPAMDHQIIRDLFSSVIDASGILKVDAAWRDSLRKKIPMIAPDRIGRYGQLQEWMQDKDDTANHHRHVSHLWAVHPGSEINWDQSPGLMKAARQSLIYRGDEATGWSLGWKINLWARFKDGNHAFKLVRMLISPAGSGAGSYPNLFDAHPPFQIDGNFGGAAGIAEMLLQSHTDFTDLLPALPDALPDGEVKGLCARGGFVIDLYWQKGKLTRVDLLSKAGRPCRLRYAGKILKLETKAGQSYSFDGSLKKI